MILEDPLRNLTDSTASSDESKTTGRLKIRSVEALLFLIGWVTPTPVIVRVELSVAVMVDESVLVICAIVLLLSTIRSAVTVILAVSTVGIPAVQLAALDQRLSPPALLNVDTTIWFAEIWPEEFIAASPPEIVIWASCSVVIAVLSVPKATSLSAAPVITTFPVPQSESLLTANFTDVTASANARFKFPLPIAMVPIADWFFLTVRVKGLFLVIIFPL